MAEFIRGGEKDFPECHPMPDRDQSRTYFFAFLRFQEIFSQADRGVFGRGSVTGDH